MTGARRRTLVILGAAALIAVVLAAFALALRARQGAPHYTPTEVLPGFAAHVKDAALIHIVGPQGSFDVAYTPQKGWVLPGRGGYPADFDQVRHTLIGLATLETIAPRTKRPDWLHYLDLVAPHPGGGGGQGTEITVKDARGGALAALILGKTEDLGDPNGTNGLFVRAPNDNQSWLARAVFVPQDDASAWLMQGVLSIGPAGLKDVAVAPAKGPAFTVSRAAPTQPYGLVGAKKPAPNSQALEALPYAIATFGFVDVAPVATVDFAQATHLTAHSFDGLAVEIDAAGKDGKVWTRLSASVAPGAPPAAVKEAAAVNARAQGWAYEMSPEKGAALLTDLAAIMKPPPAPPSTDMPPGMSLPDLGSPPGADQP